MTPRKSSSSGLRRGEGRIEHITRANGTTVYKARWYELQPDGRSKRASRTFPTQDKAEDHLREVYRAKRDGRYEATGDTTVRVAVLDYLERGRGTWKAGTYATYKQRAMTHIVPRLGNLRLVELTTARVQRWIDQIHASGLSAKTVEGTARVLNGAMKEAVRLNLITTNPVTNARAPSTTYDGHPVWDADEIARVLDATRKNPKWSAVYHVALLTGIRPGELRALQWSDIDLDARKMTVHRTITRDGNNREVVGTSTKTGRVRSITLPKPVVASLRRWKAVQAAERLAAEEWDARGFVFTGDGGRFLGSTTWQHRHAEAIKRAGVHTINLHGMRHSFATAMLARNVHPLVVSRVLGHAKIETTLNTYSHPDDALQRDVMDAFGEDFEHDNIEAQ